MALTPQQFESLKSRLAQQQGTSTGGFVDRTKQAFSQGVSKMGEAIQESRAGKNPLSTGTKFGAGAIETVFSPVSAGIEPVIKPTLGRAMDYGANKLADVYGENVARGLAEGGKTVAEDVTEVTGDLSTIFGTVAGGVKVPKVVSGVTSKVTTGVENVASKSKQLLTREKVNPIDAAISDATPNFNISTPSRRTKLLDRVEEGGTFKGRSVKPNELEIEAGKELSKVPGYDPVGTKLSKYQAAKTEVVKRAKQLETDLGNEKVPVPRKQILSRVQKAVNEVPKESLLIQKSDPVIGNYVRVLKNALSKEPGNLKGVLRVRKILDDAYENARGKQAFGSDKISALDDIHKAARDSLTQYMIDKAVNTKVKESLRSQWNLYRALDELAIAAEKESGSVIGRVMQKHPIATKVIKSAGNAVGIGQAVNLMP